MTRLAIYILFGYFLGSLLFAKIIAGIFHKDNMISDSADGNPGAANAFLYGGFFCGILTLSGDLLKGFLPVFMFTHWQPETVSVLSVAPVMVAPILGHAFPIFYRFRGGKGIAVSFGCLLGLLPFWVPVAVLAAYFLFFSLILRVTPHFYRTFITYLCSAVTIYFLLGYNGISLGFLLMTAVVCLRLHLSKEEREEMKVRLSWMH